MIDQSKKGERAYNEAKHIFDFSDKPKLLLKVYEEIIRKLDLVKSNKKNFYELTKIELTIQILNASLDRSFGKIAENISDLYSYVLRGIRSLYVKFNEEKIEEIKYIISSLLEGFKKAYEIEEKKRVGNNKSEQRLTL